MEGIGNIGFNSLSEIDLRSSLVQNFCSVNSDKPKIYY